jgi:hypothetical protein
MVCPALNIVNYVPVAKVQHLAYAVSRLHCYRSHFYYPLPLGSQTGCNSSLLDGTEKISNLCASFGKNTVAACVGKI